MLINENTNPALSGQLGDEQQRGDGGGDGLYVVFKVTSETEDEVIVAYTSNGHEEQKQDDTFPKYVAGCALSSLSQVANEVLLPHEQVHQPSKGSRNLAAQQPRTPEHDEESGVRVHTVLVGSVDPLKGKCPSPLEAPPRMGLAFMLHLVGEEPVLDHADEGDDGQQDNIAQSFLVHVCFRLPSEDCSVAPRLHCAERGSEDLRPAFHH